MKRNYSIMWHITLDSTNLEVQRGLSRFDNLSVVATKSQTSGRGQRGNTWESEGGANLTFSILLKFGRATADTACTQAQTRPPLPALPASRQFTISQIAALAVCDYLQSRGINAKIKWPNDIYCGDRKICGILIEHSVRGNELSHSIIGIGLNLNQTSFSPDIPNPTSMKLLTGADYDLETELGGFLECFDKYLDILYGGDGVEEISVTNIAQINNLYHSRLYWLNESHEYLNVKSSERFNGIIRGISQNACLIVENEAGDVNEFAFKEIEYIIP